MSMVMNPITGKMDQESILFVIDLLSITIDMMLHFDGDVDGHGDGYVTCKQTKTQMYTCLHVHWLLTKVTFGARDQEKGDDGKNGHR